MSEAGPRTCDECGRGVARIHRVRNGHGYCATCYARVFRRRLCPKCGNPARLPKNDPGAVCRRCETAKPCARCGKAEYEVGKVTPYGPVCNACAPHFRKAEPCEACGGLSSRLTRVNRFGHGMRLCPKCATSDHGACAACRRHRRLHETGDGKRLCKTCLEKGEIACQSCGKPVPAGRGKLCEECYWTGTFGKRLQMDRAALPAGSVEQAFREFGEWLLNEVGAHKAAITVHRYLPFFLEMERQWRGLPTYAELLRQFAAEGLRRFRLPMRWLHGAKGVAPDQKAREEDSERRRIEAIMASVSMRTPEGDVLAAYRDRLMGRASKGKAALRSVRLALRPAASLLLAADPLCASLPNQAGLDRYLLVAPGQKAAITGFINFINQRHGLGLVPRIDAKQVREARRRKLEAELVDLARKGEQGEDVCRKWLSAALAYFHGLPKHTLAKVAEGGTVVQLDDGGIMIELEGKFYWLPGLVGGENLGPGPNR